VSARITDPDEARIAAMAEYIRRGGDIFAYWRELPTLIKWMKEAEPDDTPARVPCTCDCHRPGVRMRHMTACCHNGSRIA
jgi:hypothetical protein